MKHTRNFSFDVPLMEGLTNYGMLNISGVGYHYPLEDKHEDQYDFDIDTVTLDGMEVPKGIIDCLRSEQLSLIETVIHNATIQHMEYIFNPTYHVTAIAERKDDLIMVTKAA